MPSAQQYYCCCHACTSYVQMFTAAHRQLRSVVIRLSLPWKRNFLPWWYCANVRSHTGSSVLIVFDLVLYLLSALSYRHDKLFLPDHAHFYVYWCWWYWGCVLGGALTCCHSGTLWFRLGEVWSLLHCTAHCLLICPPVFFIAFVLSILS